MARSVCALRPAVPLPAGVVEPAGRVVAANALASSPTCTASSVWTLGSAPVASGCAAGGAAWCRGCWMSTSSPAVDVTAQALPPSWARAVADGLLASKQNTDAFPGGPGITRCLGADGALTVLACRHSTPEFDMQTPASPQRLALAIAGLSTSAAELTPAGPRSTGALVPAAPASPPAPSRPRAIASTGRSPASPTVRPPSTTTPGQLLSASNSYPGLAVHPGRHAWQRSTARWAHVRPLPRPVPKRRLCRQRDHGGWTDTLPSCPS